MRGVPETREQRTERLLKARDAARAAGRRVGGSAPYGWRTSHGQLVPIELEQHQRWLMLHLHRQGRTWSQIAAELNRLELRNRAGMTWGRASVHQIITAALAAADKLPDTG
jgi:DNA invertase Pin-like site-specific DNA recombinase